MAPEQGTPTERPARPRWWQFPRTRRYLSGFPPAGLTGALVCYCLSLTPSLLPRAWYLQAVMSAVTVAIGYGVGLLIGWLLRSLIPWRPGPGPRRVARWALGVAAVVLVPLFGVLGAQWQHQIRELTDASQPSEANYILVVLVTAALTMALIMVARGIRWVVRLIARLVGRVVPDRGGAAVVVLVVCVLLLLLATGVLSSGALSAANSIFGSTDSGTAAGVTQPTSTMRSGGPDSLVPWDTLGRQGRTFVAGGPTVTEIARFTGQPAVEPIRVYAGLQSAPSIEDESALVVRELERTGAFTRKVLVVATTTGTGWVNPAMIDPLEYMYGGDTAIAAIQYSFLPSWITFVADKGPAQEAGRDLFDAVYGTWSRLPGRPPARTRRLRREPRVVRRRGGVQRRQRPQEPHLGGAVGRTDQRQHVVDPVHDRPRAGNARVATGLPGRHDGAFHHRLQSAQPGTGGLGGAAGGVPAEHLRPDRVVVLGAGFPRARLAARVGAA